MNVPEAKIPARRKISTPEALFARIFRIVAGKEYCINIHWNARRRSYSRPLHPSLIKFVMGTAAVLLLGSACFAFEVVSWAAREARYKLALTTHHHQVGGLRGVQAAFGAMEAALDVIFRQQRKMQALYGIQSGGVAYSSFGVGGRAHPTADDSALSGGLYEALFQAMLKSHQLRGKMEFGLKNLRQISEFVAYRDHLWDHTPSVSPARGERTSSFGYRVNPITGQYVLHAGLDVAGNRWTPIYASADGVVLSSDRSDDYGNLVVLDHGNGFHTKYGHLQRILVEKGQFVRRYALLGYMGNTGRATGVHLHYEVVRDGVPRNPEQFILPAGVMVD